MKRFVLLFVLGLCGCMAGRYAPEGFTYKVVSAGDFQIATWERLSDTYSPVHIYVEGDGHSFNSRGVPTGNPTPRGTFVRDLAAGDTSPNVVYMARPCQFIMSDTCRQTDWTDGRFSRRIVDSMAKAISNVADGRPIILIGYSGGAMVTGLVIANNPDLNIKKWITVAGVLNHKIWTDYFGDSPLLSSLSLDELPHVPQLHYVAEKDETVPISLTYAVANPANIVVIPDAKHDDFGNLQIIFE